MSSQLTPDICVIGGGPAGIAAAQSAAAAGVSVVLVEKSALGGSNLAGGTVPSKALLAAAEVYDALRIGPAMGVSGAPLQVNLNRVRDHIVSVTAAAAGALTPERLGADGIQVVRGEARFAGPDTIVAGDATIRARRIILAVGSRPELPALPGLDALETLSFAEALQLDRRPSHLLILGADGYALELAQAYARLGIDTTVIDPGQGLPGTDPELASVVVDRLRAEGIRIRLGVTVRQMVRRRGGIRVLLNDPADAEAGGSEIAVDASHLLVAMGWVPAVAGLGLAAAGIACDASGIRVDGNLRTTNRRVYAIGDALAGPRSVARGEVQARSVVRSILYRVPRKGGDELAPRVVFTDPGLASVGLDEATARSRHGEVRVLRLPFVENPRALIERQPAGMIKVIATRGGRILGAGIAGRGAAELIAPWSLAVTRRLTLGDVAGMISAYPTRSMVGSAVAGTENAGAGLTAGMRRRIIALLGKLG